MRENCQEVLSIEEEIEDLEEKMRRLEGNKPRRICPSCGEYIEEGSPLLLPLWFSSKAAGINLLSMWRENKPSRQILPSLWPGN